jgi:hypothetical protein
VGEEPGQHLKQYLVCEVEQPGDLAGYRLGRLRLRLVDVEGLLREDGDNRPGGLDGPPPCGAVAPTAFVPEWMASRGPP